MEPSAGKGDIAEYVKEAIRCHRYRYDAQIDCIEKDRQLRSLLEGKGFHVIHDDFLTYQGQFHYNLIIMNPPFADGDRHLMKALEIQKYVGSVLCILNAETIEHPYSNLRKALLQKLEECRMIKPKQFFKTFVTKWNLLFITHHEIYHHLMISCLQQLLIRSRSLSLVISMARASAK